MRLYFCGGKLRDLVKTQGLFRFLDNGREDLFTICKRIILQTVVPVSNRQVNK